ncbi:MAG: EamA family transporter, partial [Nocardioidaceae bacterium]|nr:EamA family transporter [Nocardioidaceae bacterium]
MIFRPGNSGTGSLLVISGAALFGTVGTARLLGPAAPAVSVSAVRLALAAAVLLVLAGMHGAAPLVAASRLPAVWVAGVAQAAFNVTFFGAVTRSGVALGTLVAIGCTPVLTGLIAGRVTRAWAMATGLALVGLAALLGGDLGNGATISGLLFALGASASYAIFITASSALASSPVAMPAKLAAIFVVAALSLSPALGVSDLAWVTTADGFGMVLYLAVAATVLAYNLFNRGLRTVEPGTAATLALVEPLVAAMLGVVVLSEQLSPLSWLGAGVVLVALLLMVRVAAPELAQSSAPPTGHPSR